MIDPASPSRFRLEARVGGGMADVYRAVDELSGVTVALKLLKANASAEEHARFAREIKVLSDLRHPGIVAHVDHGQWKDGRPFFAMEWLDGEDLGQRQRRRPLGMRKAVEVVRRAAQAMAAVHARGVVHRDLKLSNIFMDSTSRSVKLIDFGVVRLPDLDEWQTLPGTIIGTPHFMAPEQVRGGIVDARADVYSLGSVLFRLITGRDVFESDHIIAYLGRLVLEEAPLASTLRFDVPPALDNLIARTLSRNPDDRPPDAGELARALARLPVLNDQPPRSGQTGSEIRRISASHESPSGAVVLDLQGEPNRGVSSPGTAERRIIAVLLAALPSGGMPASVAERVRQIIGEDARFEILKAGEQLVVGFGLGKMKGDEAIRAARTALLVATTVPDARIAVATGHAVAGHRGLAGEALDRAAAQLERAAPGGIRVDRATYPLLQGRFVGRADSSGAVLLHEDLSAFGASRLLGKRTVTVGRDAEVQHLLKTFHEVMLDSIPRAVIITGPPGIGKSRLRNEVLERLNHGVSALDIVMARGDPDLARVGLSALGRAMRSRMGIRDGEPMALQAQRLRGYIAQRPSFPREMIQSLGEFVGVVFEDESPPSRSVRDVPQLMNTRIVQALETIVRHDAQLAPQVIVLEDLHCLDESSVEITDWLLGASNLRIVVYAFARPDVLTRFAGLWQRRRVTHLSLGPLPEDACQQLVRAVLPAIEDDRLRSIVERAEGNVLFLEELVRHAAEGRDELPLSVQALIQERLDVLPPEQRQVIRSASVFGRHCWTEGVSALLGRDCASELAALAVAELLVEQETSRIDGQSEWYFAHNLLCETAYASLLSEDRQAMHRIAADWLVAAGEEDPGAIALHAEKGGNREKAAGLYSRAAAQAYSNSQLIAALGFADHAVECSEESASKAQALLQRAQILAWLARYEQQLETAETASSFAEPGSDLWGEAQRLAASALRDQGRAADAESRLSWTLEHPFAGNLSDATRARLHAGRTRALIDMGRARDAQREADFAMRTAEHAGPNAANAMLRALDARSMVAALLGDFSPAIDAAREVAVRADSFGDSVLATGSRINLGFVLNRVGRFEEARTALEMALSDSRMLRTRGSEGFALLHLGMSLARLDDLDTAIELERQAFAVGHEIGHPLLATSARAYEGQFLTWRGAPGDLGTALTSLEAAQSETSANPVVEVQITAMLANLFLARRELGAALRECNIALNRLEVLGAMEEGEEGLRLTHVELLFAMDCEDEAREALDHAYECVMSRCGRMNRREHKNAFLSRLYECRRIMDLAAEHLGKDRPALVSNAPPPLVPKHSVPPFPFSGSGGVNII